MKKAFLLAGLFLIGGLESTVVAQQIVNNGPKQIITDDMKYEDLKAALSLFTPCEETRKKFKSPEKIWKMDQFKYEIKFPDFCSDASLSYKEKKKLLLKHFAPIITYIKQMYFRPIDPSFEKKCLAVSPEYIYSAGEYTVVADGRVGCCLWHTRMLAQKGSVKAQYILGYTLDHPLNLVEGIRWLMIAGNNGYTKAYWLLGRRSYNHKAYKEAINFWKKGASKKDPDCLVALGRVCLEELNDGVAAFEWYIPAALMGNYWATKACAEICSRHTKTSKPNYSLAVKYYQDLIKLQKNLRKGPLFPFDEREKNNLNWYKKRIEELKLKIED